MDQRLRAGVAVYDAGEYHAAHDAWEERWLDLESGTADERLLHGLIQYTAAVHHATNRNWAGAVGLAESALAYLAEVPADDSGGDDPDSSGDEDDSGGEDGDGVYRSVDLARAREYLRLLAADPERIERAPAWPLVYGGDVVQPAALSDAELAIAAETVAEDAELDVDLVERAAERLDGDRGDRLRPLLVGLIERPDARGTILQRIEGHVERAERVEADVEGLFDEE